MADADKSDLRSGPGAAAGASEVWAAVGDAFFGELTKHLSSVLAADLVYVGEYFRKPVDRIITLAAGSNGAEAEGLDYYLKGTAAEEVLSRGAAIYESGITRAFPSDVSLKEAGAEALAGKALFSSRAEPIGAIVAVWRQPPVSSPAAGALLEAFAPRAAAELERKRAQDGLVESEQRYRAFIANSPDAMWRIEFEEPIPTGLPEDEQIERIFRIGYIAECNEAAVRMYLELPASVSAVIGSPLRDVMSRTDVVDHLRALIRSEYRVERVAVRLGGPGRTPKYVLTTLVGIVEDGKLLRWWGTSHDVGDLRKAELEWHAWERRFRVLLETIHMAAVMLDPEGWVLFCNDYLLHITGWPRDQLLGKNWFDVAVPAEYREELRSAFFRYVAEGKDHAYEGAVLTRGGATRLMAWDRTILRDAEQNIIGTASIGRDITNQRALEQRLREADRLESVRKLAGAVAHDFNNLLTAISSFGSELLEAHPSGPERHAAEQVIKASEQGGALTRQLIAFSRDLAVEPRRLDLNDVIRDSRSILQRLAGKRIELVLDLAPSLPAVLADPGQVHQVLVNLTINAHDAMPGGGRLTITSTTVEIGEERAATMPDVEPGTYVMLDVADTGAGIPESIRMHLFQPFFTTKEGRGTGLGLASVYGIVRQSGGYVSLDSESGKGTTFHILLPALPQRHSG